MMKKIIILSVLCTMLFIAPKRAEAICAPNPAQIALTLTELCYECIFPLNIAGIPVMTGTMPYPQGSAMSPICICPAPPPLFYRIGIPIGYFEPSRMIDVTKDAWCFPSLGFGLTEMVSTLKGTKGDGHDRQKVSFQSHYYIYPIMEILGVITDISCVKIISGIDIGYMTEVDPLWNDDELGALIQPEAILFGNPITNLACMPDAISSAVNFPLDPLFWCKGAWGNAYPLTGTATSKDYVEDAASVAASMIFKLHRELILWNSATFTALCAEHPLPIWIKSSYRLQILAPIPHPLASGIGQTGKFWSWAKNLPAMGDNFAFMLFKRIDCCAF